MTAIPFFLDTDRGSSFCIHHPAVGAEPRAQVLFVHPFAEEMNKSRRMAALQSRAFAKAGYSVLQVDLHGCGDSSGGFGNATWQGWVDDVVAAARWLRQKSGAAPLWLWGLRAGCLLAAEAAAQLEHPCQFMFWQPAPIGKLVLQQFLRLRLAGEMISGQGKGLLEELRLQLRAGSAVNIAGYTLLPALAEGLERATLQAPRSPCRLEWLEVSSTPNAALLPASMSVLERWREAGCAIRSRVVHGPPFWQTTEIEEAPALITATLAAIEQEPA